MSIKITHISDTHGLHNLLKLDGGDIFIHSGDIVDYHKKISEKEILDWVDKLPYKYKIIVLGNHDNITTKNLPENVFILNNKILSIMGLKIYGLTATLKEQQSTFDFNVSNEEGIKKQLNHDKEVDILVTHGSPKGILDIKFNQSIGSVSLLEFVKKTKPKYHLFGHTHHSKGIFFDGQTTFINNSFVRYLKNMSFNATPLNIIWDYT
jgi:Icc-related predicted phosphoesterase